MRAWAFRPSHALLVATFALGGCKSASFARPVRDVTVQTQVMTSGVRYQDLIEGSGAPATEGALVTVHYLGMFEDGRPFDSSRERGPLTFTIGAGEVLPGWEQGMIGMRTGGKRSITLPPELAYGSKGRPGLIPPNSTVVIEVDLIEVFAP